MLKFRELILLIFLVLIVLSLFGKPLLERFTWTKGRRHAVMDEYDAIKYVSDKPPFRRGDYSCGQVVCPAVFEKDVLCWKCPGRVYEPQLN